MNAVATITAQAQDDETLPDQSDVDLFVALIDIAWALAVRRHHSFRAVAMALLCEGPSDTVWRGYRYRTKRFTPDVIRAGGRRLARLLEPRP